ncbi:NADPH-dependent glutamate synthase [Neofamilia massiliensis]|uniref:NADPH-dependent glutamate synthase n=1 Tax=Neofamilia massiliensis TaxID=1673724 RepID=UPI0006BB5AF9|nr:NADPH-dependent glutamate synthase [Neofamilia massiliensis]
MTKLKRVEVSYRDPSIRIKDFEEVCLGYTEEEARKEAARCIQCKNPHCISGCPVAIDIPGFIKKIADGNFKESYEILSTYTSLPAVCGRVCPQEDQCEKYCIMGRKGDPLAIGKLERFAADYALENNIEILKKIEKNGKKVAVVGSGPAGITCAGELAKLGYEVSLFEALHKVGGVLTYGIPEFRLPKEKIVAREIANLEKLGVEIKKNVLIGRTYTIDDLFDQGYEAVFIGSGAGSPVFMGIPGENLNGVFSANEFLTRANLMEAYKKASDTPIFLGKEVLVVGGGNVAMDAARTAKRFGSNVKVIYRRTKDELPARVEEVENALEEGIEFLFLANPLEILGDDHGWVKEVRAIKMELGQEDADGRKRPVPLPGSEFTFKTDMIILALGTNPNPLISQTTADLKVDEKKRIIADDFGITNKDGVFAGGDCVSGSATVILAMGAGKKAAQAIDEYLKK